MAGKENAGNHKNKSFWSTQTINTLLEMADNDRLGLTGNAWHKEYNTGGVLPRPTSNDSYGHAFICSGYDLNYQGFKVLAFKNSWGEKWGDNSLFYVKFEDFAKIVGFNVYFVLDIPVDIASWLSLNAAKIIKERDGNKCYAIQGNEKRWVLDETILLMLGYTFADIVEDVENMLPNLKEGSILDLDAIPEIEQRVWKEMVRVLPYPNMQEAFKKTFKMI